MSSRSPLAFGMLMSLSLFAGLLSLMLIAQNSIPGGRLPPPELAPPEVAGPAIQGADPGSALEVPFPDLEPDDALSFADAVAPVFASGVGDPADADPLAGASVGSAGTLPTASDVQTRQAGGPKAQGAGKAKGKGKANAAPKSHPAPKGKVGPAPGPGKANAGPKAANIGKGKAKAKGKARGHR